MHFTQTFLTQRRKSLAVALCSHILMRTNTKALGRYFSRRCEMQLCSLTSLSEIACPSLYSCMLTNVDTESELKKILTCSCSWSGFCLFIFVLFCLLLFLEQISSTLNEWKIRISFS